MHDSAHQVTAAAFLFLFSAQAGWTVLEASSTHAYACTTQIG